MSAPLRIPHPVPCLFQPPRGRRELFGHVPGATTVEVSPFPHPPQAIAGVDGAALLIAEGRAWVRARDPDSGGPLDAGQLGSALESTETAAPRSGSDLRRYLVRSPLCALSDRGSSRTGDLDPAAIGKVLRDGRAAASEAVRAFVADRIRLHDGVAYLRYERLLLAAPLPSGFVTKFPPFPRLSTGSAAHRRPGRFHGMTHSGKDWTTHMRLPPSLLGDDDAVWFANVLPGRALACLGRKALLEQAPEDARLEAREIVRALVHLERDARTLMLAGDRMQPALHVIVRAADAIARLSDAAVERTRKLSHAVEARNWRHAARTISGIVVPRLRAADATPPEDVDALSGLAR